MENGDDVVFYIKDRVSGDYTMYTYEVVDTLEVDPNEREYLLPERGYEAMLYTCTDF